MPGGWPNAPGTPGCGCATTNGQARSTTSRRSRVSSQKAARRSPGSASSCSRPAAQEGRRRETAPSPRQGRVGSPGPGSRRTLATPAGPASVPFANFPPPDTLPRTTPLEFSRPTDGGATWSSPVLIDQPSPFAIDFAPKILVLPDGTLLAVFARADFAAGLAQLYAVRSPDEGRTWLPPVLAGSKPFPPDAVDDNGIALPQPGFPSAAVAPDASVYVAFEDNKSSSSGAIGVATSRDGGRTWSSAPLPGVSAFAFEPSIAVDAHGTIGMTWYDLRNDRPGDTALTADVWFAHSSD